MSDIQINVLAVVAAALASLGIGALWYSPLMFHRQWVRAHGFTDEKLADMQKTAGKTFLVSFCCYVVMAVVLSAWISWAGATSALLGALVGFLAWAGFLATVGLTAHLFSGKAFATYGIDVAFQLVYAVAMGAILGAWR